MNKYLLAMIVAASVVALPALAESPLQTVMDGRAAAQNSNLSEEGIRGNGASPGLAQQAANIVMFVCGALAIVLTASGLYQLYQSADDSQYGGQTATKEGAMWRLVIAGLLSIPAIIAAIIPYAVLS